MKYLPAAVANSDIQLATDPYLGGEFQVFLSDTPVIRLGDISMTTSGNGGAVATYASYTAKAGATIVGAGADLQIVSEDRLTSAVNCIVTLNVVDDLGATTTATGTFAPPTRASNQGSNFGRGYAVDLQVASGVARKIASITGLASIVGGSRGCKFSIYQLPELATYVLVGATTEKNFNTKSRAAVGIDIGMEGDAAVKRGKTKKGELTIDTKFGSMADGLARFDGARCTALLVGMKDEVLTEQNLVFANFIPSVEVTAPEGDGESMANSATGKFMDHLFFVAP
ncbi:MAG: hypothetical protein KGL39_50675 [Patescibacteria group bacterium]|nr:hypothetical protein [Patescibacteria group bacterium]